MIDAACERLIPVLDVLGLIPISKPTLRRWVSSGKLEVVRAGTKVFTSREAVQRFLQQGPQPDYAPALPPTTRQRRHADHLAQVDADLRELLGAND